MTMPVAAVPMDPSSQGASRLAVSQRVPWDKWPRPFPICGTESLLSGQRVPGSVNARRGT